MTPRKKFMDKPQACENGQALIYFRQAPKKFI